MNSKTIPKAMQANLILEELERIIYQDIDDNNNNEALLNKYLEKIQILKEHIRSFREQYYNQIINPILEKEWITYSNKNSLDETNISLKKIFIDASQDKSLYIAELEGILSGDPNLQSDENTRKYWLSQATKLNEKLMKEIKSLKDFRDGKICKSEFSKREKY